MSRASSHALKHPPVTAPSEPAGATTPFSELAGAIDGARGRRRGAQSNFSARNESPDIGFDRSINPYRGCEHGCVYCFARPTHAYLGLSPGLDFESKLYA